MRRRALAERPAIMSSESMKLGAMNSPFRPLADELRRIAAAGFDYVDLTLEPPHAWPVTADAVRALVDELGLGVVGHTAWYAPVASPFERLRRAARELVVETFDVFASVGGTAVTLHPDPVTRSYPRDEVIAGNVDAVRELAKAADARGLALMIENLGPTFGTVADLTPLLEAHASVRFHLDVAHAHLGGDRTRELVAAFGDRLAHVHVSDNLGVDDLHLPLGAGSVDWAGVVASLKEIGYDGSVTLEVFAREAKHLELSRELWRYWWG